MLKMTILIVVLYMVLSGCNAVMVSPTQNSSHPQTTAVPEQSFAEQQVGFQSTLSISAKTADGTPYSFNSYKSPDGTMISVRIERRKSPALAKKELIKSTREAVEILKREPKFNEDGRRVGEHSLLTSKQEESNNLQTIIVWTDGSEVYFIESPSLQHALEFEKWYLHNL